MKRPSKEKPPFTGVVTWGTSEKKRARYRIVTSQQAILQLAIRAARNQTGRSKAGPVTVFAEMLPEPEVDS